MRMRLSWLFLPLGAVAVSGCGDDTGPASTRDGGAGTGTVAGAGGAGGGSAASGGSGGAGAGGMSGSAGAGAGGGGMPADAGLAELTPVTIEFALRARDQELDCEGTFEGLGTGSTAIQVRDMRFFVHDLRLIAEDGSEQPVVLEQDDPFQHAGVALLDFEDGTGTCREGSEAVNREVRGGVEPGTYRGLAFRVGVPEALNHEDPTLAEPPLDTLPMHWSWAAGYKFTRFDVQTAGGVSFSVHLGSTLCVDDDGMAVACQQANRPRVHLEDFDPETERVALDYAELVSGLDLGQDAPGCIAGSTPEQCEQVLDKLGVDFDSGDADASAQVVFEAEAR